MTNPSTFIHSLGSVLVGAGLTALLAGTAVAQHPSALQVRIDGRQGSKGDVRCLLFVNAVGFPDDPARAADAAIASGTSESLTCDFSVFPAQPFAVAVMHDQNGNGRLDRNLFGTPTEGYGFSADAKPGLFGPPSFEAAALDAVPYRFVVHLSYP